MNVKRIIISTAAALVANLAAPLLFALSQVLLSMALKPEAFSWKGAFGLFVIFGYFGSAVVLSTIFPVSLALVFIGLRLGWHARNIYVGGGALIGVGFHLVVLHGLTSKSAFELAFNMLAGALCGWIYWLIAVRQTPQASRAIDTV